MQLKIGGWYICLCRFLSPGKIISQFSANGFYLGFCVILLAVKLLDESLASAAAQVELAIESRRTATGTKFIERRFLKVPSRARVRLRRDDLGTPVCWLRGTSFFFWLLSDYFVFILIF